MAEVREPSPGDDVIGRAFYSAHRCGVCWGVSPSWDGHDKNPPCQVTVLADFSARLAAVEAELAEALATIERVKALRDEWYGVSRSSYFGNAAKDLATALAGPPAPRERRRHHDISEATER